jgi:lysophospholipase L1-like esterase
MPPTRRDVLAAGAAAALARRGPSPAPRSTGLTVLFQGDSITDCGRDRAAAVPNNAGALATGYPLLVASSLLRLYPERALHFFNRGNAGNKVPDLQARWQLDTIDLKPDLVSILIGVNDIWHHMLNGYAGTVHDYEAQYAALLEQTKAALSGVRLVVLEPFVLRTGAVTAAWFPEFDQRRAAAERVARAAGATWLPLHGMFERLVRRAPPEYWAADGVHPTPAGHGAIAQLWLQTVRL